MGLKPWKRVLRRAGGAMIKYIWFKKKNNKKKITDLKSKSLRFCCCPGENWSLPKLAQYKVFISQLGLILMGYNMQIMWLKKNNNKSTRSMICICAWGSRCMTLDLLGALSQSLFDIPWSIRGFSWEKGQSAPRFDNGGGRWLICQCSAIPNKQRSMMDSSVSEPGVTRSCC